MSSFKHIEGDYVVVVVGGVFKQVDLAERNGFLFAKTAGGYVQLRADGGTSKPGTRFVELSYEEPLWRSALGKLCVADTPGAKAMEREEAVKLLSAPE